MLLPQLWISIAPPLFQFSPNNPGQTTSLFTWSNIVLKTNRTTAVDEKTTQPTWSYVKGPGIYGLGEQAFCYIDDIVIDDRARPGIVRIEDIARGRGESQEAYRLPNGFTAPACVSLLEKDGVKQGITTRVATTFREVSEALNEWRINKTRVGWLVWPLDRTFKDDEIFENIKACDRHFEDGGRFVAVWPPVHERNLDEVGAGIYDCELEAIADKYVQGCQQSPPTKPPDGHALNVKAALQAGEEIYEIGKPCDQDGDCTAYSPSECDVVMKLCIAALPSPTITSPTTPASTSTSLPLSTVSSTTTSTDVMKLTAAVNQDWYRPLFWLPFQRCRLCQSPEKSKEPPPWRSRGMVDVTLTFLAREGTSRHAEHSRRFGSLPKSKKQPQGGMHRGEARASPLHRPLRV
ncbi:unnamed protein product [Heligmosomoides polygyrus]|uniref:C2 domain-containing protein n=1 Tax=Heligmosomoides polygyrus TaxID=6339 RepID=A0A3P8A6P9_HELPZ|nr:unnamed protein product [Heligmosomoides polygyrus]